MERLFRMKDPWGHGLALWVIALLLFLTPIIGYGLLGLRLENEVTTWLPEDDPDAAVLHWFHNVFEKDSKLLLSWDSSSLNDPRLQKLTEILKAPDPQRYPYLKTGVESFSTPQDLLTRMLDNRIELPQAMERLAGVLIGSGYAKVRLTETGRQFENQSRLQVQSAVSETLGVPAEIIAPVTPSPEAALPLVRLIAAQAQETSDPVDGVTKQPIQIEIPPHDFQLRWKMFSTSDPRYEQARQAALAISRDGPPVVEDFFISPGAPVAVAISLTEAGEEHVAETLAEIREVALEIGIPEEEIRMGGSPVGRARLNRAATMAIWNPEYPLCQFHKRSPVLLSTIMGVLASFILLRSLRLATLVLLAGAYTCAVTLSIMPAAGTTLNMVLIVLPNLLLVLTVSGAIHLANYWKHAAREGHPTPIAEAVRAAKVPCFLASATTAIGMASLLTAVLNPVRDFGIYSSLGCAVSLAMILIGFPAMMSVWPGKPSEIALDQRQEVYWKWLGEFLVNHKRPIFWTCLTTFLFACWGLKWFHTETKVIRYFPAESRIVQDYEFLETGLSGIVPVETVIRFNASALGKKNDSQDSGDESPRLADSPRKMTIMERMELVRQVEQKISEHPGISGALSLADFRPVISPPDSNASRLDKIRYLRTAQRMEDELFQNQVDVTRQFVTRAKIPLSLSLHGRQIDVAEGDEVWRIRAQSIVMSDLNYDDLVSDMNRIVQDIVGPQVGVDYVVTGLVPLFLRTQHAVLESLINSFALAFVLIAIVMVILLKDLPSGLLAMLPNLFPVGLVFGFVSWGGIPVDIGTMITASVALGIAIDGTLHLLTWFQDGLRRGLTRQQATAAALEHCGPAMWQTSVAIALGMQMLAGADLLLISRFGWLMSSLIMAALIGDIIFLPSLLAGGLGKLIERKVVGKPPISADTTAQVSPAPNISAST